MNFLRKRKLLTLYLVVQCSLLHTFVSSSWIYLGQNLLNNKNLNNALFRPQQLQPQTTSFNKSDNIERCRQQTDLLRNKVDACSQQNVELMESIVRGSAMGLLECQWQFRLDRWNCNLLGTDNDDLDGILLQGTREIAYLHAVTSSSLVHSITSSCSAGLINDCTCDQSGHVVISADEGWQWGGCSDNIDVGVKMSQAIIDHLDDIIGEVSDREPQTTTSSIPRVKKSKINPKLQSDAIGNVTSDYDFKNHSDTDFHDDSSTPTTAATSSKKRRKKKEGNYVINLSGSSKSKRNRRDDDVIKSKSELKKNTEVNELARNIKSLVNLHNNEVGRKTISSMMSHACRCHGVSGSCAVRTCWKALPDFRKVGDQLKLKYESSVEISPLPVVETSKKTQSMRRSVDPGKMTFRMSYASPYLNPGMIGAAGGVLPFYLKRREKRKSREPITDSELVFMEKSPNYCRQNSKKGVWGTKGRLCDRAPNRPNSCQSLCCGRGFTTTVVRRREKCDCKFVWCCEVVCRECEVVEEVHTCK